MNVSSGRSWLSLGAAALLLTPFAATADVSVDELTKNLPANWGYATEGLGTKGDEVALVFTNTSYASGMSFTLPDIVHEVRYLVVGGGGAGGASGNTYGAGGGGAGGVVQSATPLVVAGGETVTAVVGAGAPSVGPNSGKGTHGGNGNMSTLTIGVNTFTAYRGAGGGNGGAAGYGNTATSSQPTACGGGSGGNYGRDSDPTIAGGAGDVSNGGSGHGGGGGGGGAGGNGYDWDAGDGMAHVGGPGVVTTIFTDEELTIAGGGCGNSGRTKVTNPSGGGGYAGSIDSYSNFNAGDGTTWGAGGGAGTGGAKSGAGHQGVVVVRFSTTAAANVPVTVPVIASKVYTGETLTADIVDTDAYEVKANEGGVNVGTYEVVLHLKEHEPPYAWQDDGSAEDRTLQFVIAKAKTGWATVPALSKTVWEYSEEPATATAGLATNGETSEIHYDDVDLSMPSAVGSHTAIFTVEASPNFEKLETVIGFTINRDTNAWTVEPAVAPDSWVSGEEPGVFAVPAAKYGETVSVVYDGDPSKTEPELEVLGEHTVTYSIAEGETYAALEKTITYTVTKKFNGWATAPVVVDGNIEDGLPAFTPPTALNGDVSAYYDGDPSIVEPPTNFGSHTVTYAVAENDEYQGYSQTIGYQIAYKPVFDSANPSVVCGYRMPRLGAGSNEVAVVFTNTAVGTMTFTLPRYVTEISYLVVGGGASGARSGNGYMAGGGGAGGVETNAGPYAVEGGVTLAVAVGAGGAAVTGTGNGKNGQKSTLAIGEDAFVALPGGGGGYFGAGGDGLGGDDIACGGGAGSYNGAKKLGGKGQTSNGADSTGARAGGGGAGGDGFADTDEGRGQGGIGVPVTIFGDACAPDNESGYYVAGGGCGAWASQKDTAQTSPLGGGGCGGGKNSVYWDKRPESGSRWGAGGGGVAGGATYPSGAGHQGVVVVRYVEAANVAVPPTVPSKTYAGETLVAEPVGGLGWTIIANEGGVDVGKYSVTVGLADGYGSWDDGSDGEVTFDFEITVAENAWTAEPAISKNTWLTTDEPGVLTAGATAFGTPEATIVKNDGEPSYFHGELPTAAGRYVITYVAPVSDNWTYPGETEMEKSVSFEIVNGDDVPPFAVTVDEFGTTQEVGQVSVTIPYAVTCEVQSSKTVDLYALYAIEGAETTNEWKFAEGVALDAKGVGTIPDLMPGENYFITVYGRGGDTVSQPTPVRMVTVAGPATDLAAAATFTNDPKEFVISGSVVPGLGKTTVYLRWSFNSDALDNLATFEFKMGDEGAFAKKLAYAELTDTLTWDVSVSNAFTTVTHGPYAWSAAQAAQTASRAETKATTYTWNGAGGSGQWLDIANWTASDADCYGVPNSYDLATARFADGDEPIEVKLADDVSVKALKHEANAPALTIDLDGHTLTHNLSERSYGAGVGWQYFTLRAQSGRGPLTFKNGTFVLPSGNVSAGQLLLDANSHVCFDNVKLPTTKDLGATYKHKDVAVTFRNGCTVSGLNCIGGEDFLLEVDNSTAQIDPVMSRSKNARFVVRNGSKLTTSDGAFSYQGENVTLQVEGEGTSADLTQSSYGNNGFSGTYWTIAALDGAEVSLMNIVHTFTSNAGDYDIGTRFVVSNATFRATGSVPFCFGIHTNDETCVSPTIALAGTNATFRTAKALVFGTDAELAKPPTFELNPAANGLKTPCVTSDANAITIGSNVCVKVITDGIRASGGTRAKVTLARVKATGTLAVDVDALAANTTIVNGAGEPDASFKVKYGLVDVTVGGEAYKALTVRISGGGFAVIVR